MLRTDTKDKIYNALIIGMALEDAYIYAGLTAEEIKEVSENEALQLEFHQIIKSFEFGLLNQLNEVSKKQIKMGKETATTWMLEHMFTRYSGKPQEEGKIVNISFNNVDPTDLDTVEIMGPSE